jgi:hypothetical protein
MQKILPKALLLDPNRFNSEALMNDLIKKISPICINKSLVLDASSEPESSFLTSKEIYEGLTNWIPYLINTLSAKAQFRLSTLQHAGEGYLVISLPAVEIFSDSLSAQSINMSYVLNKLAGHVNYVVRQHDHNGRSGFTIRMKLR